MISSILPRCHEFLKRNATGTWHETYRFKDPDTDKYLFPVHRGMMLIRVESGERRAFYWIYNFNDAIRFAEYVGLELRLEAHEIILTPQCRFFYDVDLALDEFQKNDLAEHFGYALSDENEPYVMDSAAESVAAVFKEALLISLEEHGTELESDLPGFDWLFTLRNRPTPDDGFKISIHIVTNLILSPRACAAIATHVKEEVLFSNTRVLGISDSLAEQLADAIDCNQYRRHGSLSLPYGTKMTKMGAYSNLIWRGYDIPGQRYAITAEDRFSIRNVDVSHYNVRPDGGGNGSCGHSEASADFVAEALRHVGNISDYSDRCWDVRSSVLRGSTMFVKRYAPSMCSMCDRVHDKDNTLFLIFDSDRGVASWKCARMPHRRPVPFYRCAEPENEETATADEVEQFVASRSPVKHTRASSFIRRGAPPAPLFEPATTSPPASEKNSDLKKQEENPASSSRRIAIQTRTGSRSHGLVVVPTCVEGYQDDPVAPKSPAFRIATRAARPSPPLLPPHAPRTPAASARETKA